MEDRCKEGGDLSSLGIIAFSRIPVLTKLKWIFPEKFDESSSFVVFLETDSFYIPHKFLINRISAVREKHLKAPDL